MKNSHLLEQIRIQYVRLKVRRNEYKESSQAALLKILKEHKKGIQSDDGCQRLC